MFWELSPFSLCPGKCYRAVGVVGWSVLLGALQAEIKVTLPWGGKALGKGCNLWKRVASRGPHPSWKTRGAGYRRTGRASSH